MSGTLAMVKVHQSLKMSRLKPFYTGNDDPTRYMPLHPQIGLLKRQYKEQITTINSL